MARHVDPLAFMQGGGEMGELMRRRNWDSSELGAPEQWPVALKSAISSVLNSGTAMHLSWGGNLLQFYNDAYTPILSVGKHPAALGRSVRESFPEAWDFIEPLFDRVLKSGEAITMENARLMLRRDGGLRESFFSFSYSPLKSLSGEICGVASVCWETTEQVILKRRERSLRLLAEQLAAATSIDDVRQALRGQVADNRQDLLFLLWYECSEASRSVRLVAAFGISTDAPLVRELGRQEGDFLASLARDADPSLRDPPASADAGDWLLDPPAGACIERIAVEPLCFANYSSPDAFLVFGVAGPRPFDGSTKRFLENICHGLERAVRRISAGELERRENLRQFEAVTGIVPSMVWMTDAQGDCTFVSKRWMEFTGRSPMDSLGLRWMNGLHPDEHAMVLEVLRSAIASRGPIKVLYRFLRADGVYRWMWNEGAPRHDERGQFLGMVGSSLDITERKALEEELAQLAATDPLTGLSNRRHLRERLIHVCQEAERHSNTAGLIFMDLDNFKTVNDSLTHEAGDAVLQEVAARLLDVVADAGLVARLGGDEFAIVLPAHSAERATAAAERIARTIDEPFIVQELEVFLTASLGVAMAPADAGSADELISCADLAMFEVKRRGRNGIAHYEPALRAAPATMLSLRGRMARGLERDEYHAVYQPIATVTDGRILAAEALLRWQPPDGEAIGPSVFIPVAEETGLIVPLSERMMKLAFAQAAAWRNQGHPLMISVNLSSRQLREPDICRRIEALAANHGVAPDTVQLEITESLLMENREQSERQLLELKRMGFRIALDDFGTGYSSLSYLKSFPIDSIKIDGSFIRGMTSDSRDVAVVRSIIGMSRDLGITTVAEGVETPAELARITTLGCDYYQGYLLARPLPGHGLAGLLSDGAGAPSQKGADE